VRPGEQSSQGGKHRPVSLVQFRFGFCDLLAQHQQSSARGGCRARQHHVHLMWDREGAIGPVAGRADRQLPGVPRTPGAKVWSAGDKSIEDTCCDFE
jgi:hypothetical protein